MFPLTKVTEWWILTNSFTWPNGRRPRGSSRKPTKRKISFWLSRYIFALINEHRYLHGCARVHDVGVIILKAETRKIECYISLFLYEFIDFRVFLGDTLRFIVLLFHVLVFFVHKNNVFLPSWVNGSFQIRFRTCTISGNSVGLPTTIETGYA